MENSEKYNFSDFTHKNYRRLLKLAEKQYAFRTFSNFRKNEKFILWRHDVDFSMEAAGNLARIEKKEGIQATYFINLHNEYYHFWEKPTAVIIKEILRMGHKLGIHFDYHFLEHKDRREFENLLKLEREIIKFWFGCDTDVFSFHIMTDETRIYMNERYAGMVNASSGYFRNEVGYCSDSNGYWRHRRLEDVLRDGTDERLQVLTHPVWWQAKIMSPKEKINYAIETRARNAKIRYERLLKKYRRKNIDW